MNARINITQSEQALPSDVSVQSDTWLTRYRNYPVFSRIWFKHRTIAFGIASMGLILMFIVIGFISREDAFDFLVFGLMPYMIGGISLLLIGQGMAVWIKLQQYTPKKEAILISLAIIFGLFGSLSMGIGSHYALSFGFPQKIKQLEERAEKKMKERAARDKFVAAENKKSEISASSASSDTGNSNSNDQSIRSTLSTAPKPTEKSGFFKETILPIIILIIQYLPLVFIIFYQGSFFDLYIFFRQRKRLVESLRLRELKQAQEARREAELRLSVLVAQVEPHFLFNTLAGVRSAILTEPLRATVIVDHLVDYLRATIPSMRDDGTSNQGRLAQQLESAKSYLGLMQARIPRLSFEVSSDIKDAALPPLILISLVENAIKHGIEPKVGPVHISVSATISEKGDDEFLEIAVCDNGVGFGGATSGSGIGLANIRERLESTYGNAASLTLKARTEGGVEAKIVLPLTV